VGPASAATFTPFRADGALDVKRIQPSLNAVIAQGADRPRRLRQHR
jgi:dihydrodipicolinate synthase/N-acetylneuraminate lyase